MSLPRPFRSALPILLCLAGLGIATAAPAQDAPPPTLPQIVEAWLASPHADGSTEAFRHWDEDGEIPGTCAVCHSSTGVVDYLRGPMSTPGVIDHPVRLGSVVDCTSCHSDGAARLAAVPFPSGVSIDVSDAAGGSGAGVCTVCHQGRASGADVARAVADLDPDGVSADLRFINVHYAASAAAQMGSAVQFGFEYDGKDYAARFDHVPNVGTCTSCHDPHTLRVDLAQCTTCHEGAARFEDIRTTKLDILGDGDTTQGIAAAIAALLARLDGAIMRYAAEVGQAPIAYSPDAYPYFFADSDADGLATEAEAIYPNRYQVWTPRLLKAAYNYQLVAKSPAIYAHNPHYALQLLYDSLEDLGQAVEVDMAGLSRP